jgi:SAM-dependent methyltransferase
MINNDLFNLTIANSSGEVDQANKEFYGRFNYPWPPMVFSGYPAGIMTKFLNQDIGSWGQDRIPGKPRIWVAGCGTNQALFTALKYPEAEVIGTDISTQSIMTCRRNAAQIGVNNLQLTEMSLNDVEWEEEFDYIICTGVIHHNADPAFTLSKLAGALKKNGVLELMVYNYYHRILTTACQKALRSFDHEHSSRDIDSESVLVKHLMADYRYNNLMDEFLKENAALPEAEMADNLLQPVEYSYTIESLGKMIHDRDLDFLSYCVNQADVLRGLPSWNMRFTNSYLRERYDSLPDSRRWQISNLLLFSDSPMLWFYLQRKDSIYPKRTEQEVCNEFLETRFGRTAFELTNYELGAQNEYILNGKKIPYPLANMITDKTALKVLQAVSPEKKMKDILYKLAIKPSFTNVNTIRQQLSTLAFPFILAQ